MSISRTLNAVQSALISSDNVGGNDHSSASVTLSTGRQLLVSFAKLTGDDQYRAVEAAYLDFYFAGGSGTAYGDVLDEGFDEATATYSRYQYAGIHFDNYSPGGATGYIAKSCTNSYANVYYAYQYGAKLEGYGTTTVQTSRGTNPPRLRLTLGDVCGLNTITMMRNGPFYRGLPSRVSWLATCSSMTPENISTASAVVRWRTAAGATEHEISVGAGSASATIPAGQITGDTIQWQVEITANSGVVTTSDWFSANVSGNGWTMSYSPSGGYLPKTKANTFSWAPVKVSGADGTITQSAATFRWRPKNGSATEVSLTTQQSYTVPANTFSTNDVEWQVETTNNGVTQTSAWMQISTEEELATATPLDPVNTMVDGSAPVVFRWAHEISTGTAQTAADLQISSDGGTTWSALASVSGPDTSCTVAAGTLSAGSALWRVRSYNTDSAAGEWSDPAQIVVVAASPAPIVSAPAVPLPLVTWQAEGQQGWELRVDGETVAHAWGSDGSWQITEILEDGQHVVGVRVQNQYGLWSAWGETAITVANSAGSAISISATSDGDAAVISWVSGAYSTFRVLRDGTLIAETALQAFTDDHAAAGAHSYQVIGILANGNYGRSSVVTATVRIRSVMLQDVSTGEWLSLNTSLQGQNLINSVFTPDVAAVQYAGRGYPLAEIGEARARSLSLRPAFPIAQAAAAKALEALLHKQLFYKDPFGEAFPAVITALSKDTRHHAVAYNLTLTETSGGDGNA